MKPYKKIILAGGNGYLGTVFSHYYRDLSEEIILLSRTPKAAEGNIKTLVWDGKTLGNWANCLENADLLINLCGKNVNCRYTKRNKEAILSSRVLPTKLLGTAMANIAHPPKLWINITSATIYRHAEDQPQDEIAGEIGDGFSVNVCNTWENTFFEQETPFTRKIALRMSLVLGNSDGVFPRLRNLVKYGMGGKQGNGKQYVAWVHEQDAARATEWIMQHEELEGTINCTAPEPVKNTIFMQAIRKAANIPFGLPAPKWLLEIGAVLIGTETELILKSRWVVPRKLANSGFKFQFPKIEAAVADILHVSF